jgi:DNA-binding HxlR family transcriptional regulator
MSDKPYGLFCPIAKACEVLEPRWTMPILAEMSCGTSRFNELRRGMPRISPSLLSKRLKEMEEQGLVERIVDQGSGTVDYVRTPRAVELHPILVALGHWAQRNIDAESALCDRDPATLMWLVRRKVDADELPPTRIVILFHFTDVPKKNSRYWLVAKPGVAVDLCLSDPGFTVDLYIDTQVPILTGILFGRCSLSLELEQERLRLIGAPRLSRTIDKWLKLSYFAPSASLVQKGEPAVMSRFTDRTPIKDSSSIK